LANSIATNEGISIGGASGGWEEVAVCERGRGGEWVHVFKRASQDIDDRSRSAEQTAQSVVSFHYTTAEVLTQRCALFAARGDCCSLPSILGDGRDTEERKTERSFGC
jgi:hypothetical protein